LVGNNYDEAYDACKIAVKEAKGTLIHPFDDPHVIAGNLIYYSFNGSSLRVDISDCLTVYVVSVGQGTIGLEIMDQIGDLDLLVVPVVRSSNRLSSSNILIDCIRVVEG